MNVPNALDYAAAILGGKGKLCLALKLHRQNLYSWRKAGKVPLPRALQIEELTGGRVRKEWLVPGFFNDNTDSTKQVAA
jgi:DNA-binding transcriptional regulator YdaS (Cro superfamily)